MKNTFSLISSMSGAEASRGFTTSVARRIAHRQGIEEAPGGIRILDVSLTAQEIVRKMSVGPVWHLLSRIAILCPVNSIHWNNS